MGDHMFGRFVLIAICFAAAAMGESAHAQAGDPAVLRMAAQALSAKIDVSTSNGTMAPRLADPDNLVRKAFDRTAIRTLISDMPGMLTTCQSVFGAFDSYMSYITKQADGRELAPEEQQKRQMLLQDETTLAVAAADLCSKGILMAATKLVEKLPPADRSNSHRIAGAAQMRNGMAQLLKGSIEAQSVSTLRPANRALLRESTMDMADVGADAMTLAQRAEMLAVIDAVIKSAPASSTAMLQQLRSIYSQADCTGLCALR